MKSRAIGWVLFTGFFGSTAAAGCGGGSGGGTVGLASGCSLNSDCDNPLVCVFGLCHEACASDRDCPMGERCVSDGKDTACQLPGEASCSADAAACGTGLSCFQGQCLNGCSASNPCAVKSDMCVGGQCIGTAGGDSGPDVSSGLDSGQGHDGTLGDSSGQDSSSQDSTAQESSTQDSSGQDSQVQDSSGGRDARDSGPIDAGPLGYIPSNFNFQNLDTVDGGVPEGGVNITNPPDISLGANCVYHSSGWPCLGGPSTLIKMSDGTVAELFVVGKLTVQSSIGLNLIGAPYPVIIAAFGDVQIDGAIDAGAAAYTAGPGGWSWANGVTQGPGGGGDAFSIQTPNSYAGGGSFCGVGGLGATSSGARAQGGGTYGTQNLIPLVAGSAGGSYAGGGDWYGSGGGAFQISSRTSILIQKSGWINASGGGGYGGGGSGGAILLEAPAIDVAGNLAANGGGAGTRASYGSNGTPTLTPAVPYGTGGQGSAGKTLTGADGTVADAGAYPLGAGRIRLNTQSGKSTITGIVTPDLSTACATQAKLTY